MDRPPVRLFGATCGICRKGTLEFEYSRPVKRPDGHIKKYFHCTACKCLHVETTDPRIIGERTKIWRI